MVRVGRGRAFLFPLIVAALCCVLAGCSSAPVVGGAVDVEPVAYGVGVCAAMSSGPVHCWGRIPTEISGTDEVRRLAAGGDVVCGVRTVQGGVVCWHARINRTGVGDEEARWVGDTTATAVGALGAPQSVAVGDGVICGITEHRVRCVEGIDQRVRLPVRRPETLANVASGLLIDAHRGCAILTSARLTCWGDWVTEGWTATPPDLSDVVSVAVTANRSACAVRKSGAILCMGEGAMGELGPGVERTTQWRRLPSISDAVQVVSSATTLCARRRSGGVVCWGESGFGRLGDGRYVPYGDSTPHPTAVIGIDDATDVIDGCAVVTGGFVRCWGDNFQGRLGDGTLTNRSVPVTVRGL